jgi:hypothetical protein
LTVALFDSPDYVDSFKTPFSRGATEALNGAFGAKNDLLAGAATSTLGGYANYMAAKEAARAYQSANAQKQKSNIWGDIIGAGATIAGGALAGPIGAGLAKKFLG